MEITGKCIAVLPMQSGVSAKGNQWASQEYVIEIPGQFPRKMTFKVFGEDRIRQFNIQPGFTYRVPFDIDAREYNGRWYNSINAYNVTCIDLLQPQQQAQPGYPVHSGGAPAAPSSEDLPF